MTKKSNNARKSPATSIESDLLVRARGGGSGGMCGDRYPVSLETYMDILAGEYAGEYPPPLEG